MKALALALLALFVAPPAMAIAAAEREAILLHGPWPPEATPDPSNRASGDPAAIALGQRLFFDVRLSRDLDRACASCHQPAQAYADGRPRGEGLRPLDRNTIALANLRGRRWYGWDGRSDSLWAQSLHPIVDERELAASGALLRDRLEREHDAVFGPADDDEIFLVDIAKALAAWQETLVTPRSAFDDFRDALEAGDAAGIGAYPAAAQRGLKLFVGRGQCATCHFGPMFSNGEFDSVGITYFLGPDGVDRGRHGGIAALRASPFNLLGRHNDDPARITAVPTAHVALLHRNWGEFRVPSLRGVKASPPYMHDGSLATLTDVVRHYSEIDLDRLHQDGQLTLQPLHLNEAEIADLVAFLETL
jgi:cytochrome c peroxidase